MWSPGWNWPELPTGSWDDSFSELQFVFPLWGTCLKAVYCCSSLHHCFCTAWWGYFFWPLWTGFQGFHLSCWGIKHCRTVKTAEPFLLRLCICLGDKVPGRRWSCSIFRQWLFSTKNSNSGRQWSTMYCLLYSQKQQKLQNATVRWREGVNRVNTFGKNRAQEKTWLVSEFLACHSQSYKSQCCYVCSRCFYCWWWALENLCLVGFDLVLPSFSQGCFRPSGSTTAGWQFTQVVCKLHSHVPLSATLALILIKNWHQRNAFLPLFSLNKTGERIELSAVKFSNCSPRKGGDLGRGWDFPEIQEAAFGARVKE